MGEDNALKMKRYVCNDCGFETDVFYKAYEHLNESDEEDKIFQEGMSRECESFRDTKELQFPPIADINA